MDRERSCRGFPLHGVREKVRKSDKRATVAGGDAC